MKKKLLSLILTLSLLIPLLSPLTAIAEDASTPAVEDDTVQTATETKTVPTVSEPPLARPIQGEAITESNLPFSMTESELAEQGFVSRVKEAEHDLNSIVLENADGSLTLHYYNHPVKYVDEDGVVRDKSDKLKARIDGSFETVASDIRTAFPKRLSDGITMQKGNHTLRMAPTENLTSTGTLSADQTTVTYAVNARTYYEYSLTAMGFKEDILVLAYTGQTEYSFTLQTGGLTAVNQSGTWVLVDEDNTVRASFSDVIVFTADERNNTFGELRVEEITAGQIYRLTVVLDADWLADSKTVYPITIDPSVTYNTTGAIEDLVVGTSTTYNGKSGSLYVGRGASGAKIRTLMRFPNLNISGYNVTSAYVMIRDLICQTTSQDVECYEYKGEPWQESDSIAWTDMGDSPLGIFLQKHSVVYGNGNKTISGNAHRYAFDITALAQMWASGTADPAKGVIFKATDDYEVNGTKTFKTFASINRGSNPPTLTINYTPVITLSPSSSEILVGETLALTATFTPADTSSTLTYTSSNNSIATVSDTGVVTGVSAGTVTITASDTAGNSGRCTVTVNATSLILHVNRNYACYGEVLQLYRGGTQPEGTTYTWSTSNSSIATVNETNEQIEFTGIGKVDITLTASTGDSATVTVYGTYPDGVYKLQNWSSKLYATLDTGLGLITEDVNLIQYGNGGASRRQLWRVHYLSDGQYSIRSMVNPALVMSMDSEGNIQRNVQGYALGVSDSSLPERAKWSIRGSTYYVFIESFVNNNTYQLAIESGNAQNFSNVFAITSEGSGTTYWTLHESDESPEGVDLYSGTSVVNGATSSMDIGETKQLTAIYYTAGDDISQGFTWTSSNPAVATVDKDTGLIHAVGNGLATITVTSKVDSRYSAYFCVYVSDDLDYDGISSDNETNSSSNVFSGTLRKVSDDPNKVENYSAEYTFDYRAFLDSPHQFNADLCQLSSVASTIIYRNWHFVNNETDIGGIRAWLNYHGMSNCTLIDIGKDTEDYNNSQIVLGYRPVSTITDSTIVVAVVIRGTTGLEEWSSNMDVGDTREGTSGDWTDMNHHKGFDITANRILSEIDNYIRTQIENTKWVDTEITYWVTGHSRGGALSNLVAADLIEKGERVFAYTFASPATTVCSECENANRGQCMGYTSCKSRDTKYDSIFNIVNEDDFITYFPLKQWYFTRYGKTATNLSINSGYKNEWESKCNAEYMLMANPKAPFDKFYEVVPERNFCYDYYYEYSDDVLSDSYSSATYTYVDDLPVIHPDNTLGYYMQTNCSSFLGETSVTEYQKPMFIMMYFAAMGANVCNPIDFVLFIDFAPYLHLTKNVFVLQVTGASDAESQLLVTNPSAFLDQFTLDKTRIEYPHRPVSYYYLSSMIESGYSITFE